MHLLLFRTDSRKKTELFLQGLTNTRFRGDSNQHGDQLKRFPRSKPWQRTAADKHGGKPLERRPRIRKHT